MSTNTLTRLQAPGLVGIAVDALRSTTAFGVMVVRWRQICRFPNIVKINHAQGHELRYSKPILLYRSAGVA